MGIPTWAWIVGAVVVTGGAFWYLSKKGII
jgi:hypothetical protein